MREILFKAKRMDNKEQSVEKSWVEGYYAEVGIGENIKYYIIQNGALPKLFEREEDNMYFIDVEVDPKTVCQYIGKIDKSSNKIWENDIVKTNSGRICKVVWFSSPQYQGWDLVPLESVNLAPSKNSLWSELEVVGNIFDNSELLNDNY